MDKIAAPLFAWWRRLDDDARRRVSILLLATWVYLVHYVIFCVPAFFIDDAGISFAYARNLVEGHGLVAIVGGERVEGFSNPLWTFVLAALYAVGVPVWTSSKILGGLLGCATLPIVAALVEAAAPGDGPWFRRARWMAPLLLAGSPQFVIWNASGLECSLFSFLLSLGILLVVREANGARPRPSSAIVFLLLSATRPEGIMYGCIAFAARALVAARRRRFGPLVVWVLVLAIPWLAFNTWRYEYFAWPFPNTYYAKLGVDRFAPFDFDTNGWAYVAGYFQSYWTAGLLPLVALGLAGAERRRVVVALSIVVALVVSWKGAGAARVFALVVPAFALGLATLTRRGWYARGLLWVTCSASIFFAVYVGGDWMHGYRWFNTIVPTLFPIAALGLAELLSIDALQGRAVRLGGRRALPLTVAIAVSIFTAIFGVAVVRSGALLVGPETEVREVHRRVTYMSWVQDRLDLGRVKLLDIDMGAHLYFTDWDIVDMAGLVDVPIAHHPDYDPKFMREYLYEEERPDFAHVHDRWARTTKIPTHPEFENDYIEIPGYPIFGRRLHVGAYVRKDLFVRPYEPGAPVASFASIDLVSLDVDALTVAPGGRLHLVTAWHALRRHPNFRVLVVLESGNRRAVSALPPGYDWYAPPAWKATETVETRHWVDVPLDFPLGPARIGFVVLDAVTGLPLGAAGAEPSEIPGTWWSSEPVRIVTAAEATDARTLGLGEALVLADQGACDQVWEHFRCAARHVATDPEWIDVFTPIVHRSEAECFMRAAASAGGLSADAITAMQAAVAADRDVSRRAARAMAASLDDNGDAAAATGAWKDAYDDYLAAIRIEPTLSWTRKKLERVRDERLGLTTVE